MIEVEKKFILDEKQKARLIEGAQFLGEKVFTDIYYDNAQFSLSSKDIWLRERAGVFELKLPAYEIGDDKLVDQYQEIVGEKMIREIFAIPEINNFVDDIAQLGHQPFCTCTTTRKKYQKENFIIDLDEVTYAGSDLEYAIGEIELLVEKKEQIKDASEKIMQFAKEHGLNEGALLGKVLFFVKAKNPKHFAALKKAGILRGDEK